jgi:GT2 family glycosyltransferase
VLNYNGIHFLNGCFSSINQIEYPTSKYEVIMIDNGSTDDSVNYVKQHFPWVRIILLKTNLGFGEGNNKGIRFARGQFVVFLNNDTIVTKYWLLRLVEASVKYSTLICASKTILMSNHQIVDYGGGKFTPNGRGYSIGRGEKNEYELDCINTAYPCAASMLIEKKLFLKLGGFDKDYFACFDDTDLGWRAWLFGHSVLYCPTSIVYHDNGATSGKGPFSPLKTFHGTKDSIITILKNFELQNIFFGIALAILYDLIELILLTRKKNLECLRKKMQAYPWLLRNLGYILQKRIFIQNRRVVSDKRLCEMHLLVTPYEAFKEYFRLSKFPQKVQ